MRLFKEGIQELILLLAVFPYMYEGSRCTSKLGTSSGLSRISLEKLHDFRIDITSPI
jgi:hypothetical protein